MLGNHKPQLQHLGHDQKKYLAIWVESVLVIRKLEIEGHWPIRSSKDNSAHVPSNSSALSLVFNHELELREKLNEISPVL